MPGSRRDYKNSKEEASNFVSTASRFEILGNTKVEGVKMLMTRLGHPVRAGAG